MKYIKKLNIDFDQWDKLKDNKCTYLIFKSGYNLFLSYIKNNNIYLLNNPHPIILKIIENINKSINDDTLIYYRYNILYKELIKTDFYKNNKILIVGIDVDKEDILKNPKLYEINNNCKNEILI